MVRRVSIIFFSLIVIFSLSVSAFAEGSATVGAAAEPDALDLDPSTPIAEHVYSNDYDTVCNDCGFIRRFVEKFEFVDSHVVLVDNDSNHKNLRAVIYSLGDVEYTGDPTDENSLSRLDPEPVTKWGLSDINKIELVDPGNYVVVYKYNIDTNLIREPLLVSVVDPDPEPDSVSLVELNENLSVIQSLLWFFAIILVCYILWKFFRWFF